MKTAATPARTGLTPRARRMAVLRFCPYSVRHQISEETVRTGVNDLELGVEIERHRSERPLPECHRCDERQPRRCIPELYRRVRPGKHDERRLRPGNDPALPVGARNQVRREQYRPGRVPLYGASGAMTPSFANQSRPPSGFPSLLPALCESITQCPPARTQPAIDSAVRSASGRSANASLSTMIVPTPGGAETEDAPSRRTHGTWRRLRPSSRGLPAIPV